jgi:hypothetical protein
MSSDWCRRLVLYSATNASTAAWASASVANGVQSLSSSFCRVWWNRSIFPVVVGDRGLVR